ncbi:MAG: sigma-70 family RNA polymerase sigma factor, partial [Candidatus Cybelea sp.]
VWPDAYRIAAAILRDHGLAEDAAQNACEAIVRALPSLHDPDAFGAWSYKIIANNAMSLARRRRSTRSLDAAERQEVRFNSDDALDLADALGALPVVQRGAIILHYYAGLTSKEIAQSMKLPDSTVRFHLMLARRRLRAALSEAPAGSPPAKACQEVYTDVR